MGGDAPDPLFSAGALVITTLRHKIEPELLIVMLVLGVLAVTRLTAARRTKAALLHRKEQLTTTRHS